VTEHTYKVTISNKWCIKDYATAKEPVHLEWAFF